MTVLLSRRTLFSLLSAVAFPLSAQEENSDENTADVIVVGSGFAGLSAAIEAKKAGADVLLVEKMKSLGGNSALCAGDMAVPNSPVQRACGITDDSPERMLEDILATKPSGNAEHARAVVEGALPTWRWTINELGVSWNLTRIQSDWGQSVPRGITLVTRSGFSIVQAEVDALRRLKGRVLTGARMDDLLFEGNIARGISITEDGGHERKLIARRGIVLAYGGFGADVDFRSRLDPRLGANVATSNQPGATSEAWKALIRAGAKMLDLSKIQVMGWNSSDERGLGEAWPLIEYGTVAFGQWFDIETGEALLERDRSPSKRMERLLERSRIGHGVAAVVSEKGVHQCSFPPEKLHDLVLQGIVTEYENASALTERTSIAQEDVLRIGASDERFYTLFVTPKVHHAQGGLMIDSFARVHSKDETVMKGLYAAGECTGGLFGSRGRIPSHSVTDALVMGRIAGKSAVKGI